jgi:hypothetical protein
MKAVRLLSALAFAALAAPSMLAQANPSNPGTIVSLEFQKPKMGMTQQYEDGRKQKAAWHKQQNSPDPLLVWETLTGEDTGTYIVGGPPQHWAEFDKPAIPEEADRAEFTKVILPALQSMVARYYEYQPKLSNPPSSKLPLKYEEVVIFHVHYGKASDFRGAVARAYDATVKTKWPPNYEWYELQYGGPSPTWVLIIPHDNWAAFEDQPNVKPFRDMLKDAFGQAEADSIVSRLDTSVASQTSEIIQFRPDLSYIPAK